jgi:hypothetical protein
VRSPPAAENPEKIIVNWIPDLDFVSSGMTFGIISRIFQFFAGGDKPHSYKMG